jgi:hypothetical protein
MTLVQVRVTDVALKALLRLPDDVSLVTAAGEALPGDPPLSARSLLLVLDMPGAPDGAMQAEPVYTRQPGDDPVALAGMRWYDAEGGQIPSDSP